MCGLTNAYAFDIMIISPVGGYGGEGMAGHTHTKAVLNRIARAAGHRVCHAVLRAALF